jgi:hypothetical protein
MPKKRAIKHSYNRKKDRFNIRLKRFSLKKKRLRLELLDNLLATLDKKPKGRRRKSDPNTRIEVVGEII